MARSSSTAPWRPLLDAGAEDERLVARSLERARDPRLEPVPGDLHPELVASLARRGIERLYGHQAQAAALPRTQPFVVTTGTASGKSLCFQLPAIDALLRAPRARALFLYPTKALAQDQARSLHAFGLGDRLRVAIYDGDTPREARRDVRRRANVVLTNPDMLHVGILPRPDLWSEFLTHLRVVVIDEAHVYRGVFGSHVSNVLRRLRRLAERQQAGRAAGPRFLMASATIANPVEHAQALTGLDDVALIDEDGSPGVDRQIAMWNPPLFDEDDDAVAVARRVRREDGVADAPASNPDAELLDASELIAGRRRRSALGEAADMLADLVLAGVRTICFVRSRKGVEVVARMAAERLREEDRPDLARQVIAYRAGYTTGQRHELEQRLVDGEVRCVVTTTALELGIDIGQLDACVVVTFPGTVASLRQMWGRAGRRGRGLAVYVAGEDALDQYFCRHPGEFLGRPVEAAILHHENEPIHLAHLLCAAHEAPLDDRDAPVLGPRWRTFADQLAERGDLRERGGVFRPAGGDRFPAGELGLRSATSRRVVIVDGSTGEELGHVEHDKAPSTVHQGAVYLHLGEQYEVQDLDLERGFAVVEPFAGHWWTAPKREIDVSFEQLLDHRTVATAAGPLPLSFGVVTVTDTVLGYQRRKVGSGEMIDLITIDLPSVSYRTEAVWYEPGILLGIDPRIGPAAVAGEVALDGGGAVPWGAFPSEHLLGSLHAAEHAQIAVLPLLAMCDRWDVGGLSTNLHPQAGGPAIIVYEGHVGGVGIARQGFDRFEHWVADAGRLIAECPCDRGCPSCVQSPKCGNLNEPLHKAGALELLARLATVPAG
ncbi:DEAD/DEAH box helicase [Patulibacter defluvii]|uniref:DEAD/DEAH box helicase n=1 Tax=Patulibacter defluvii TaxID=3095358 RepID=UPI002A755FAF|nr:DEAD/DEAH box helicase [Patulibacter sp. DM4]